MILGGTGRNLGAGMSGGTAYVHDLRPERVNRDSLASGELSLLPLESADVEILTDLLRKHVAETDSTLASRMLDDLDATIAAFVKVLPRDYAAVLKTRQMAVDEGLPRRRRHLAPHPGGNRWLIPRGLEDPERELPPRRPIPVRIMDWKEVYEQQESGQLRRQAGRCMDCGVPSVTTAARLGT